MTTSSSDNDLSAVISAQRRELTAAQTLATDLDFAYDLQLQEAIRASLNATVTPPSSPPQHPPNDNALSLAATLLQQDTENLVQIHNDGKLIERETKRMREDLNRRIHDQKFAKEIMAVDDQWWKKYGDDYHKPYDAGSSSSSSSAGFSQCEFRVYVKGLVSEERVRDATVVKAGIGVAVCDLADNLVFEKSKKLKGGEMMSTEVLGLEALIEGLSVALELGLERIAYFCDHHSIYDHVTSGLAPGSSKIAVLVNQVRLLQGKFIQCNPNFVVHSDMKFAFKLARDAILAQITWPAEVSHGKCLKETCVICFDDTCICQMFPVDGCLHRFCFSCMKKHVEAKLLDGLMPKCPHEGCKSDVDVDSCKNFLDPKFTEIMIQRIREASIAVAEKVYCPFPKCSALMSKSEVLEHTKTVNLGAESSGVRKCIKCRRLFCIHCRVPWHTNMTCEVYKRSNPSPIQQDAKLKSLASKKLWRQCSKCNNMVELAWGCYHITCRCGHEFCYTCGADWKDKKPTCKCRLWDERNIVHR